MNRLIITIIVLLVLVVGCDKKHDILINGNTTKKEYSFDCGKIVIQVTTFNGQYFFIKQDYDLHKEAIVYPDSLTIEFKGSSLPFTIIGSEQISNESIIELNGEGYLKFDFEASENVSKGDTIILNLKGYLFCNGEEVKLDKVNLIIDQDF